MVKKKTLKVKNEQLFAKAGLLEVKNESISI